MRDLRPLALVLLLSLTSCATPLATNPLVARYAVVKPFDIVLEELEFAITERNFRIVGRHGIGKAIRERGHEDFPNVAVIHFCNLEYAREMLQLDVSYVAWMPCRLTVHERDEQVIISAILLPENHPNERLNEFAARMNAILRDIASYPLP